MFNEFLLSFIGFLLLIILVLVGVAFLTLLERKVLGYVQIRKGPNKVGFIGLLQPFSDAVKLFTKEQAFPVYSNYYPYFISPIFSLFLSLSIWLIIPYSINLFSFNLAMLFFLCCASLGVYSIMVAGWSSNSSYSLLGGLRAVAQTISYEVSLAIILLSFVFLINSYSLIDYSNYQSIIWMGFIVFPLCLMLFTSCLAETNRTPFDFAEGESELVSGFNVEYSSGGFALIFLAEYSSILFMSCMCCILFFGSDLLNLLFYLKLVFLSFLFIWARGTLPRFRYDKLMYLAWSSFLPISLNYLLLLLGIKILFLSLLI